MADKSYSYLVMEMGTYRTDVVDRNAHFLHEVTEKEMKKITVVGIVGSEAAKFTPATEALAREIIRKTLRGKSVVVSGACHLGGIDEWAVQEAKKLGIRRIVEFAPAKKHWDGYKARNIQIAERAEKVVCITVKKLPPGFKGMRFPLCYHCKTTDHVKSGGCWTAWYAKKLGKPIEIIAV